MNMLSIEFKDGRTISLRSEVSYREAIQRINAAQMLFDDKGLPIDLTNIKHIRSMED